jgi:hypothetical protein
VISGYKIVYKKVSEVEIDRVDLTGCVSGVPRLRMVVIDCEFLGLGKSVKTGN